MANVKTAKELFDFLKTIVDAGKGDYPVLFDTEAKTFNYHMAFIDRAYDEEEPFPHVQFHEKRYKASEAVSEKVQSKRSYEIGWNCPGHESHDPSCSACVEISQEMAMPVSELIKLKSESHSSDSSGEKDPKKFHWYVTYSFSSSGRSPGNGSVMMWTTENWFPIKMAREWILKDIKADSVVISNWKKISKQQYEEASNQTENLDNKITKD